MSESNRSVVTYDAVKTANLVGPVEVTGSFTGLDDVFVENLFFVLPGIADDAMALLPRQGIDSNLEVSFACVDPVTGEFEDRVVFKCPVDGTTLGQPALQIPDFATQGLIGFVPSGIVAFDVDGNFRPIAVGDITEITCETIVADPDCITAFTAAVVTEINTLVTTAPTDPTSVAFGEAVAAALGPLPALLECADLDLNIVQYVTEVQAPCVAVGEDPILALPPTTDFPAAAAFAVFGNVTSEALPDDSDPEVTIATEVDVTDVGAVTVTTTVTIDDTAFDAALTTDVYSLDTTLESAYDVRLRLVSKGGDADTISIDIADIGFTITVDGVGFVVPPTPVDPVVVDLSNVSTMIESAYLVDNTADIVTAVVAYQAPATTLVLTPAAVVADINASILDALTTALPAVVGLDAALTLVGVSVADLIADIIGSITPDLTTVITDLSFFGPVLNPTAVGPLITFSVTGVPPLSDITVRPEVLRTPLALTAITNNVNSMSTKKSVKKQPKRKPLKKSIIKPTIKSIIPPQPVSVPQVEEPRSQVRIFKL